MECVCASNRQMGFVNFRFVIGILVGKFFLNWSIFDLQYYSRFRLQQSDSVFIQIILH